MVKKYQKKRKNSSAHFLDDCCAGMLGVCLQTIHIEKHSKNILISLQFISNAFVRRTLVNRIG